MIQNTEISNLRNLLNISAPTNKSVSMNAGTIVKARVMEINKDGGAVLRVAVPSDNKGNTQAIMLKAFSEVALSKGQTIYLEVLGGKTNIQLRFIGDAAGSPKTLQQNIPARFLDMLSRLTGTRLENSEFKHLVNMLESLPENIKTSIPEFRSLEHLLINIKQIDGRLLKAFVETSGVAFETRLRIAFLKDPGAVLQTLLALQAEGDLKGLLLRLRKTLKDRNITHALRQAGFNVMDMSKLAEKFIRNIEFFQLTSRLNDMFYTFLPVLWEGMKDGELMFKTGPHSERGSFTCDLNLDLDSLGKLSVSITVMDRRFYITFLAEEPSTQHLINSQKHLLEKKFSSQGMSIKALNIRHSKGITFSKAKRQGVDVKI